MPQIHALATESIKELKKLAFENPNAHVAPNMNPGTLNWVEFQRYR